MTRIKNGPIVREKDRTRPRELGRVLLICLAFSGPVFFYVWAQVTHYQVGQQVQEMERLKARLLEDGRRLDLERARLTALGRVDRIAREDLGFVDGTPVEILTLDGRSRQEGPAELLAHGGTRAADHAGEPGQAVRRQE